MMIFRKFIQLLTARERYQLVLLLLLMFIGMILELIGISLVVPVIALMTHPDLGKKYQILQPLLNFFGGFQQAHLIIVGMLTLVALYFIKMVFSVYLFRKLYKFVFGIQANLSYQFFAGYMRQPWTFHLQHNSAQLINIAITEISQFINSILLPMMFLLTDGLVMLGVITLLFIVEPLGTFIIVSTLGIIAWAFHRVIRNHLLHWGRTRQYHEGMRLQLIQEGLAGVKEVKLLGREKDFFAQYNIHNLKSSYVNERQRTVMELPRLGFELLAVISLAVLVIVMVTQNASMDKILPTVGLFAAAAFRIMPSANRMMSSIQSLYFGIPAINTLYQEAKLFNNEISLQNKKYLPFKSNITLESVRYQYPNSKNNALNNVTLTIERGMSVGFVGASGVGKSTLIDIILGLLTPHAGYVKVDGMNIQENLRGWQDHIGYVSQSIFLTDDTLRRNIAFGLEEEIIDDDAVQGAIKAAQLEEFVNHLPEGLNTFVGERGVRLSGGQRQRIGIARALYHDPAVLVLDEATSALDTTTEKEVMKAVIALHGTKTLLIVAHRMSTVSHCDWLYDMDQRKIIIKDKVV